MKSKISSLILAATLALVQHGQAFTTTLNIDIFGPITGGSGVYNLRLGTYQNIGGLSNNSVNAYNQLVAGFNTAYTVSGLDGAALASTVASYTAEITSPYSNTAGFDNSIFWFLTDTGGSTFGLYRGNGAWNNGQPFAEEAFGLAADSVTAIYGSLNTGSGTISANATAIPEPASGSLFLLGAAGVLALRRLRKTNV